MSIKKELITNALKIRGSQSLGDSIYRKLNSNIDEKIYKSDKEEDTKNGSQTVHKRFTEPNTNGSQTVHNTDLNGSQKNKTVHKRFTEPNTNGSQTVHKRFTEPNTNGSQNETKKNLSNLIGIQRQLILSIYQNCKTFGGKISQEMTIEHLSNLTKCNKNSIKTTIFRLKEKGFIEMVEQKNGRGGWTKYKIHHDLFSDILQQEKQIFNQNNIFETDKRFTNSSQMVHERFTEPNTEPNTTLSSSSSFNNITTTTNKKEIPRDWLEIDIEPLDLIRLHKGHIEQLYKHDLDINKVQESIYHFAFDLTENNKSKDIKTEPLGFFMGIMKRTGYYAAPENYESPQERGHRLFLEQEAKKVQQRLDAEKNLLNIHFEVWSNSLTHQEKIDLVGKDELGPNRVILTVIEKLREYYKNNFWKDQYKKIIDKKV